MGPVQSARPNDTRFPDRQNHLSDSLLPPPTGGVQQPTGVPISVDTDREMDPVDDYFRERRSIAELSSILDRSTFRMAPLSSLSEEDQVRVQRRAIVELFSMGGLEARRALIGHFNQMPNDAPESDLMVQVLTGSREGISTLVSALRNRPELAVTILSQLADSGFTPREEPLNFETGRLPPPARFSRAEIRAIYDVIREGLGSSNTTVRMFSMQNMTQLAAQYPELAPRARRDLL